MASLWARFWGLNWWLKGSAIFVVFIIVVAIIASATGSGSDDGDSSDTEVVASTAEATDAPDEPTAVPDAPATEPPAPTDVPEPTDPPEPELPALSTAECAYMGTMGEFFSDTGGAMGELTEGFLDAAGDILLLADQEWIIGMAAQMAILQVTYDRASGVQAPASMSNIHTASLEGLSKLDDATNFLAAGIDNFDADSIERGTALFASATTDINTANNLLSGFSDTRSGSC